MQCSVGLNTTIQVHLRIIIRTPVGCSLLRPPPLCTYRSGELKIIIFVLLKANSNLCLRQFSNHSANRLKVSHALLFPVKSVDRL